MFLNSYDQKEIVTSKKKTRINQDMSLERLREEPISKLKQHLSFYRKEY